MLLAEWSVVVFVGVALFGLVHGKSENTDRRAEQEAVKDALPYVGLALPFGLLILVIC